jgi:cell division protein FtsB
MQDTTTDFSRMSSGDGGPTIELATASMSMADVDIETVAQARQTLNSRHFWNSLSFSLAAASTATAILAMLWSGSVIVYVAMSFSLFLSSCATVQRFKLSRQETLRQVVNQVRSEMNRLQRENNKLHASNNKLETQVDDLQTCEAKLANITQEQNTNTNTFIYEVKQNALVQEEIQELLMMNVMQNVLSALLQADSDGDFQIDPEEVDILILRVKMLPGVERVDEARIKDILLSKGSTLDAIWEVVNDLSTNKNKSGKPMVQVSAKGLVISEEHKQ